MSARAKAYGYRHVIGFEETNLVGNVYYVNHLRWQGRCRELFLRDHAPDVLAALERDVCLVTTRCSCEYYKELCAFDDVLIQMRLGKVVQNRLELQFEYWRQGGKGNELVARGDQEVACMERRGSQLVAAPVPASLRRALRPYEDM